MKRLFKTCAVALFTLFFVSSLYGATPRYGGKLTIISVGDPVVVGYSPEMGPADHAAAFPGIECLINLGPDRQFYPQLAERWVVDPDKNTMTFYIRKGVKFHDGSDLTAEVVKWNLDLQIQTKKIPYQDQIKRVAVEGSHKVVLYLTDYHNQMEFAYGWTRIYSKQAFDTHGKDWMKSHVVATGPFKQVEWKRGSHFKWTKFEDYWDEGKPYLDEIEYKYIPDPVTASSMMQARVGDIWISAQPKEQYDLVQMGLVRQSGWTGLPSMIYINTKDKSSPLAKLKVREALEYAMDKAAMAKALGFGYQKPLYMFHPEGNWAHDPTYAPRTYNPEKARQLLKEAGYPRGLKLDLLAFAGWGGGATSAEAIKAYLGDVGVQIKIDMSDPGRYFASLFGTGWKHLILSMTGIDKNSLGTFSAWFGHEPRTNLASFERPDELIGMSKVAIYAYDELSQAAITRKISRYISDNALLIPIADNPAAVIMQTNIHTTYMKTGLINWQMADMWMD